MEIVNQYTETVKIGSSWGLDPDNIWILGILLGIGSLIGLIAYVRYRIRNRGDFDPSELFLILILAGAIFGSVACFHQVPITKEKPIYEVKFSDMPYVEVIEKYDVLEHRGEIFVIQEKEED